MATPVGQHPSRRTDHAPGLLIVGTNFGEAMLRDIPNQRELFALLAETPGITMPRADVGGNTAGTQSSYQAYGLSGQSITTVDGVNITVGSAGYYPNHPVKDGKWHSVRIRPKNPDYFARARKKYLDK